MLQRDCTVKTYRNNGGKIFSHVNGWFFSYSACHSPAKDSNTDVTKRIQVNSMKYRIQICYKFSENTYMFSCKFF